MKITLKLFATLSGYLPAQAHKNAVEMDVNDDATIGAVLDFLGVPREQVHLTLVDGLFVPPGELDTRPLRPDETLAVWPPVAGG